MRSHTKIEIEPFEPNPLLQNTHIQTVLGATVREQSGIEFRRERIELPDGDFVDLDFADPEGATWAELGNHKPIAMFIHGLEGNARSGPACQIYRDLSRRGVRCLGMNLRSCSGEINRTARLYHAGATEDVAFVHKWLEKRFPGIPIGFIGVSLGGNILLKYLGENGEQLAGRVAAAVAISPPFDLLAGSYVMAQGVGKLYTQRLLAPLKEKVRGIAPLVKDIVDLDRLDDVSDFRTFDDLYTAKLHGFDGVDHYYESQSSQNFLEGIRVPTLLLRAQDDPFFDPADLPRRIVARNPYLYASFPAHGGHVGFVEGTPGNYGFWAERQTTRFLALVV